MSKFKEGDRVRLTKSDDERKGWEELAGREGVVIESSRVGTPHEGHTVEMSGHGAPAYVALYQTDTANFTAESIEPEESLV